ncbi:hypothetical protein H311_04717, partial [Anncaliia algerae PRA109]
AQKAAKTGKMEIASVSRVDQSKGYIDLSRLKVTPQERVDCLKNHHRNKLAHNTMITIAKRLDKDLEELYTEFGWPLAKEYGSLYNFFVQAQENNDLIKEYKEEVLESIKLRFKPSKVKVMAQIKVNCFRKEGIHSIKRALSAVTSINGNIEVTLIKPPIFSVFIVLKDGEKGILEINQACLAIKKDILVLGGSFDFIEKPQIIGGKDEEEFEDESDSDDSEAEE